MNELLTKISISFTLLAILIDTTHAAMKCYECTVYPKRQINQTTDRLCSKFEETEFFEVECPFSTMCKKRTYRFQLNNGDIQETTERGCAMQKNDYMNYVQNKWVKESSVEEPYTEGCLKDSKDESEYCHCRGNLCNSVGKMKPYSNLYNSGIDAMSVIVVFNLVKYFRSMDYL